MKIKEIFDLAIKLGKDSDFRGEEHLQKHFKKRRERYENLLEEEKDLFDLECLENPYMDSRIHNIADNKEIKKVLVGIDIAGGELCVSDKLGDIDLVIGHHPIGRSLSWLSDVMELQIDV
ncbi:MAG: hypothetical protein WCR29_07085, partial [Bacteroidales bacterium]